MILSRTARRVLAVICGLGLVFLYLPLAVVVSTAVSESGQFDLPPDGFTLEWFQRAFDNAGAREALGHSLIVASLATLVALVLGSLLSFAVHRFEFFGRDTVSLMVVLPIALPGIVTGVALSNTFTQVLGIPLSLFTVIVGHATFCIVVVYNNVVARLRRTSGSFEEASADLGAHTWQTFRFVTFPSMKSALGAGALLAFALSFDEIIVTNFTIGAGEETLPIWIFRNLFRPNQLPIVDAVAVNVPGPSDRPAAQVRRVDSVEAEAVRAVELAEVKRHGVPTDVEPSRSCQAYHACVTSVDQGAPYCPAGRTRKRISSLRKPMTLARFMHRGWQA